MSILRSSDILHLPRLRVLSLKDSGDFYTVQAEGTVQPTACPHCGNVGLFGHGSQLQKFIDTPTHGKRLLIEIERKRYRCKDLPAF